MLEKILSTLPYDNSQIHKLGFYLNRLKKEKSIRSFGIFFILLAFLMQYFAVINPPQPSVANSSNDIINGGFTSASQAAYYCNNNTRDYKYILNFYGVTCDSVSKAKTITLNSRDYRGDLWSMGRNDVGSLAGETPSPQIHGQTYYIRYLWSWDASKTTSNYKALDVSNGTHKLFLLFNCGNITSVGFPTPVTQSPKLSIMKTTVPGTPQANSKIKPGTEVAFRIIINNSGGQADNLTLKDTNSSSLKYISQTSNGASNFSYSDAAATATWKINKINAGSNGYYIDVKYSLLNTVKNDSSICNSANLSGSGIVDLTTNKVCFTVSNIAPPPPPTPSTCPYDKLINLSDSRCIPCSNDNKIIASDSKCKNCMQYISSNNANACVIYNKSALNLTTNSLGVKGNTAKANDVIKYTLTAKNGGTSDIKSFIFQDNLSYVLDYSTLVQAKGVTLKNNSVVFPATTLKAGETKSVSFEVKILNPIPYTPVSTSDPLLYNLTLTNTYGNTLVIKLPSSPAKAVESTIHSLPNTGPGGSMLLLGLVAIFAGYFFYRSRLLTIEANIAAKDASSRSMQ